MKSHRLNGIPIVMYLMTHAYFNFYHVISNIMLRKVSHKPWCDSIQSF
jgi:cycloeucalenol cycloisomerase